MDDFVHWVGPARWLSLAVLGFLAGVVSALFGVGGGIVTTPLLNLLGLPMPLAVATSTPVIFGSSTTAAIRNRKIRGASRKVALWIAVFMLPSVELFARLMVVVEAQKDPRIDAAVRICFIMTVLVTTATWLFKKEGLQTRPAIWSRIRIPPFVALGESQQVSVWVLALSGMVAGFLAGFLGLGGGRILVPVMIGVLCMPLKAGVATSSLVIVASSLVATVSYARSGLIDYGLAAALLPGAIARSWFGSAAMQRIESRLIRVLYLMLSGAALISLCLKQLNLDKSGLVCLTGTIGLIVMIALFKSLRAGVSPPLPTPTAGPATESSDGQPSRAR